MKKFQKLIPAFCLLLVSAVLMGTSTFAWFSMNKTVKATGMTISAKSDSVYLVINTGASFNKAGTEKEATSTVEAGKKLYPVAPVTAFTNGADVAKATGWHYTYSDANNDYKQGAEATFTVCTEENLTDYVASETFYIGLNEKSGKESAANLKVGTITLPENTGIKVVIVCDEKVATNNGDLLAESVTTTGVAVTVYYYIDGAVANVYSDNVENLTGNVVITFTVD